MTMVGDGIEQMVIVRRHGIIQYRFDFFLCPVLFSGLPLEGTHNGEGIAIKANKFEVDLFHLHLPPWHFLLALLDFILT